jgi:hypothetical protein
MLVVRPTEERDLASIWRIYENCFGKPPTDRLRKRWQWQFIDNPACRKEPPSLWVAEIDGNVVAQRASFPAWIKIKDREMVVQFECDFAIDQEARNLRMPGLSLSWPAQFLRQVLQRSSTPLKGGTDYTPAVVVFYKRLAKVRALRIVPHCSRPCRVGSRLQELSIAGKLPKGLSGGIPGQVGNAVAKGLLKSINVLTAPRENASIAIRRIDEPTDDFDRLWRKLRSQYPVTSVRNRDFIRWRFFEDPVFENVLFGAYLRTGELVGYVAVRTGDADDGEFRGRLLDLFCDLGSPAQASSLLRAGIEYLEEAGVATITCRGMHPELRRIIRKSFYRPSSSDYEADQPALFEWRGAPELADAIYDENNWHFTYADGSGGFSP